jgi:hypothetical protein
MRAIWLIFFMSCSSLFSQESVRDIKQKNIKSINEISYKITNDLSKVKKHRDQYDRQFDVRITFNKQGDCSSVYRIDSMENLIRVNCYGYQYNNKQNKIKEEMFNSDSSLIYILLSKYDSIGNLVIFECLDSNKNKEYQYIYLYDSLRNEVQFHEYNSKGTLSNYRYKEYDNNSNIVLESHFDKNNELLYENKYEFCYDSLGNVLGKFIVNGSRKRQIETYIYSQDNKLLNYSVLEYLNDKEDLHYKMTWYYNSYGDLISQINYDELGRNIYEIKYEYQYDLRGNCIRRIEFKEGKPFLMLERKILYYN